MQYHICLRVKLVLDTSVMVAALRSRRGASRALLRRALEGSGPRLLASVALMIEYEAAMTRPEHLAAAGAQEDDISRLLDALAIIGQEAPIAFRWRPMLRDPGDDMILETAANGQADAIVTFNVRDFAGAERFGIEVLRPGHLLERVP